MSEITFETTKEYCKLRVEAEYSIDPIDRQLDEASILGVYCVDSAIDISPILDQKIIDELLDEIVEHLPEGGE